MKKEFSVLGSQFSVCKKVVGRRSLVVGKNVVGREQIVVVVGRWQKSGL